MNEIISKINKKENKDKIFEKQTSSKTIFIILILIFVGPWLLTGLAFLVFGLFSSISEHNQTKGYEETTAI